MSLTAAEIAALVEELQPLRGARVDAVRLHAERALTLEFFGRAGTATLLLSAEPDRTRLHAVSVRPPAPPAPPSLQPLLRRELEGARLASLEASPGERVVELVLEKADGQRRLVAELTGRHGNLFLLDAEGRVRAAAGRDTSQRRLCTGALYRPPAARAEPGGEPPRFVSTGSGPFPLSAAVELLYAAFDAERLLGEGRRRLRERLRAALARGRRALDRLAKEADRVPAAEADRRVADLLKQHLGSLKRGMARAELTEWTEEGPRTVAVALDPALGPRQNMERYYRRYRRIADSAARVAARQAEVRERLDRLAALAAEVEAAGPEELPRLEREARRLEAGPRPAPRPRTSRAVPEERLPYRSFRSLTGVAILVGRSPADNDALTVRVARGNDLWLHVRGGGGAHVVARLEKGQGPDQETLLDAAHLAAHFSSSRGAPTVDVAWTRARHVRKARGAAPGAVTFSQDRTLLLRVEPARLARLLAAEGPDA